MPIDRVYVTGWRGDVRFTRCCVASIRRWYPDIPIVLIKDLGGGDYDTRDLERYWGVGIYRSPRTRFGVAGKLELLFAPPGERFLAIDSDIVFLGRVLDVLDRFGEDFVVNGWDGREDVDRYFYDVDLIRQLAPDYPAEARAFNAGQFVASSGLLGREEFDGVVEFSQPPRLLRPDIFRNVDQGPLNLVVLGRHARQELTVRWHSYMWWPAEPTLRIDHAHLEAEGYPMLLHWAGFSAKQWRRLPYLSVLQHFERRYYDGIPRGRWRWLKDRADETWRIVSRVGPRLARAARLRRASV